MTIEVRAFRLILCLTLFSAATAFTQAISNEAAPDATAPAPVAYVYVQTANGINVYDATATGKLTMVKGSPFKLSGPGQTMVGGNGKYFITLGANDLHSYPVASNGAIGKQVSQIDTYSYSGSECSAFGAFSGIAAEFDPTGKAVDVLWNGGYSGDGEACSAIQTFAVNVAGGLTFVGDLNVGDQGIGNLLTFSGNNKFAAFVGDDDPYFPKVDIFARESNGLLENPPNSSGVTGPEPAPGDNVYQWEGPLSSDSTNHFAVVVSDFSKTTFTNAPDQLASFTVSSKGEFISTNTYKNMPTVSDGYEFGFLSMSPSGKILATNAPIGTQLFHFNGTNPITKFTSINVGGATQWDKSNHLYILSGTSLYVYTVTPTSVVKAPGSPYPISGGQGLVVVTP
jgi:hypothetical protein